MSPIGAPGALMPKDKKPGLGSKAASALGAMMDQAMRTDSKKRKAQLELRNIDLKNAQNEFEGTSAWNQENYEWEAMGVAGSEQAREAEYNENMAELKQLSIMPHMSEFDNDLTNDRSEDNSFFGPAFKQIFSTK
jgi:hypothetical protein